MFLADHHGSAAGNHRYSEKGDHRYPGQHRKRRHQERAHPQGARVAAELAEDGLVGGADCRRFRHEHAGRGRHDQRRYLADQPVADGEHGIGLGCVSQRHVVLGHADNDPADDVDQRDDQAGDRVAPDELGRAVHGTEKVAFVFQFLASRLGRSLVDKTGGKIGIDRHLFAGHGVQGESRRDLCDPPGTLGDNNEIHQDQDGEDDNADDEIAAHNEAAEGFDDGSGG